MSRRRIVPRTISPMELKWNQIANPEVIRRAATAPVRGHGLGSTMWYACAWWAIKRFLVNKDLGVEQRHRLELLQRRLLRVLGGRVV